MGIIEVELHLVFRGIHVVLVGEHEGALSCLLFRGLTSRPVGTDVRLVSHLAGCKSRGVRRVLKLPLLHEPAALIDGKGRESEQCHKKKRHDHRDNAILPVISQPLSEPVLHLTCPPSCCVEKVRRK